MKRKEFIWNGFAGISLIPFFTTKSNQDDRVEAFVRAGHNDLDTVKDMLKEDHTLVYSSYHWGAGDFETALEGAGHVGNHEIAEYLIHHGARPNLFTMAMLGENDEVITWLMKYPETIRTAGPHGFTLLHHATVGDNTELVSWLNEAGLTERKVTL